MFGRDAFHLIGKYLDGKDAAWCRVVCKEWRHYVDTSADLTWKISIHLVMLTDVRALDTTLAPKRGVLKSISATKANDWIQNVLWFRYRANALEFETDVARLLNLQEEGHRGWLQNSETKELVYANNYYGTHAWRCGSCIGDTYCVRDCTVADHVVARIQCINQAFPGFIVNWKCIHFPFIAVGYYEVSEQEFHRGTSFTFTLSSGGLEDVFSIQKSLRRMDESKPGIWGFVGRGNKRRMLDQRAHAYSPIDALKEACARVGGEHGPIIYQTEMSADVTFGRDTSLYKTVPYNKYLGKPRWYQGE